MRTLLAASALIAAASNGVFAETSEQLCAGTSQEIAGNYYCQAVQGITYQMPGDAGSYQAPTSMPGGPCSQSSVSYGSGVAPLDEDVSVLEGFMTIEARTAWLTTCNTAFPPLPWSPSTQEIRRLLSLDWCLEKRSVRSTSTPSRSSTLPPA
jgi:hypothetical protein